MTALLHCSRRFHFVQRTQDLAILDQAFEDLLRLHKFEVIKGAFILQVGHKGLGSDLEVTVWRERRIVVEDGWLYARDPSRPAGLTHQYTKAFALADTLTSEIIHAIQQVLFCPFDSADCLICTLCGTPLGRTGGFRMSAVPGDVQMVPLCRDHLAAVED